MDPEQCIACGIIRTRLAMLPWGRYKRKMIYLCKENCSDIENTRATYGGGYIDAHWIRAQKQSRQKLSS